MIFKIILRNIKQTLNNFLPIFLHYYLTFLGLFWVTMFLYFRFFAPRTSYTLESLKTQMTIKHYIGFSLFIIIHLVLLSVILFNLLKKKDKETRFSLLISKIQIIIRNLLWKPLDKIHEIIAPNIPGSGTYFLYLEQKWTLANIHPSYFYRHFFLFNILPKIIVSIIFFIDIIILGHFKYFLYSLPLIIIPILFNIFLKTFQSFAERNIPLLQDYFSEIKYVGDTFDANGVLTDTDPTAYEYYVKPEYAGTEDLNDVITTLNQLGSIVEYITDIKQKIQEITPYVTLFTSSIYLLGGVYRLYYFF
jgi:hypothetical protein